MGSDYDNAGSGFDLKDLRQAFSKKLVLEKYYYQPGGLCN